jgi:nanoRNase/pAp phosphatase (c-di-AMP/oligoRNAs hydrolase)
VASPKGFSALARRIKEKFVLDVAESPDTSKANLVVVVDTGDISLLDEWVKMIDSPYSRKIFIDHHPLTDSTKSVADFLIVDDKASSSSEIVYQLFKAKKAKLSFQ